MNFNNIKKNKGFTILETLVAVLMLSIVLNSIFALVSSTLFSAKYAKNDMIASYLLQEASDYIRNERDSEIQADNVDGWDNFLSKYSVNGMSTSHCKIDVSPDNLTRDCGGGNGNSGPSNIYYNPSNTGGGYYKTQQSTGATLTSFTRSVDLEKVSSDEVEVTITVSWQNGSSSRTRTLRSTLTNWQ